METLVINGKPFTHHGPPLTARTLEGEQWSGLSNLLTSSESIRTNNHLNGLSECFWWMKEWSKDCDVAAGYVLDFTAKTAYYDNEKALTYLQETIIPKRGWENYFEHFVQKDFSK